ncbi:MAG: hypothetical protein Q9166_002859 [cf. Caloplaca sp. 2 TL-2023]
MYQFPMESSSLGSRRNAIKPDEAEQLIRGLPSICIGTPGNQRAPRRSRDQRASKSKNLLNSNDYKTSSPEPTFALEARHRRDVAPVALLYHTQQPTTASGHQGMKLAQSQQHYPMQARTGNKRKHRAFSEEEDNYARLPPSLDVVHPSEIKSEDEEVEAKVVEIQGTFALQVLYHIRVTRCRS